MAKTTYRVKKGDSFASLGFPPSAVMALNPGVPKLSQGQTIWVPGNSGAGTTITPASKIYAPENLFKNILTSTGNYISSQSGFRPAQTSSPSPVMYGPPLPQYGVSSSGSFLSGAGQVNTFTQPHNNFFPLGNEDRLNPAVSRPAMSQAAQGSFVGGGGQVNTQGQTASASSAVATPAARPTGTYAENPDAWRAYWNASATAGKDVAATAPAPVHVPTRAEVWNMKARQRKRQGADDGHTGGLYQGGDGIWRNPDGTPYSSVVSPATPATPAVDPTLTNLGNAVNTALSWRVG